MELVFLEKNSKIFKKDHLRTAIYFLYYNRSANENL